MKTFRIAYLRRNDNEAVDLQPDYDTVFDEVEFEIEDGNETSLLTLFAGFISENDYEFLSIQSIKTILPDKHKPRANDSQEKMSLAEAVTWLKKYQGYLPIDKRAGIRRHSFDLNNATVDCILEALRLRSPLISGNAECDPHILNLYELSTAHLCQKTREALQNQSPDICEHIAVYDSEYGWFLTTMINDTSSLPSDLARCIEYARNHNCCWLHFDSDTEICENLPCFD